MGPCAILVVDDEPSVRDALDRALRMDGYRVQLAADGTRGARRARPHAAGRDRPRRPDARARRARGLPAAARRRATARPVLMLTARDAVPDRVKGLDAGADDYLVKPFALEELGARLRALLRRSGGPVEETLRYAGHRARPRRATPSHRGERLIELTRTEFLLLELLMNHPRQVLTRTQIFEHVWGYDFGPSSNSLEVYVGYLRRKLAASRGVIQTVRGVGYVLRETVSFRRRLALSCGAAVAVAVVLGSVLAYWIVRDTLRDQIDDSLRAQADAGADAGLDGRAGGPGRGARVAGRPAMLLTGEAPVVHAVIRRHAAAAQARCPPPLGDDPELQAVAQGTREPFFADRDDRRRRTCASTSRRGAERAGDLRRAAADRGRPRARHAALGARAARAGRDRARGACSRGWRRAPRSAPWSQLTETAEHVATTRDLSRRIEAAGRGRGLAPGDARSTRCSKRSSAVSARSASSSPTPRTSCARRSPRCARTSRCSPAAARRTPSDRDRLRADLVAQLEELTALVGDLVELARDEEPEAPRSRTCGSTGWSRPRSSAPAGTRPAVTFETALEPALVQGVPARLDRAVANLLDNAAKWSPPGGGGRRAPARRRADRARPRPGHRRRTTATRSSTASSAPTPRAAGPAPGSGLAIVRQVAEGHGGTVAAEAADGGGALLRLRLPVLSANP